MEPVETQPESLTNLQESSRNLDSSEDGSEIYPTKIARGNVARVSLNGNGSDLDGSVVGTQVTAAAMRDRSDVKLGRNEGVLEDSEMKGMQESKISHGLDIVLDENKKTEFDSSNGIKLVADLCGDVNISDTKGEGVHDKSLQCEPLGGNEMEEEANSGDEEHDFSVGDFVWGKIRSHPWWPGRIYDPLDASDYAKKVKQGDKILVAYFGDDTFAWCNPSQLKPLEDNFVEMSTQSISKNFVNSVENAMDEIGRLVDLRMTCSCVPKENLIGFGRTLVVNAGIKEGLLIPEGGIDKFSSGLFEPVELLTVLKDAAQDARATSMLEFTVLKSWLSAFYRAKGGQRLPSYYDPEPVPGLEDKSRDWTDDIGDHNGVEVRLQGPEEEYWISSPRGRKYGQTIHNSLQKSHRVGRKQKSLAEIMEGGSDVQTSSTKMKKRSSVKGGAADEENNEADDGTEGVKLHKLKSAPGGKKGRSVKNDDQGKDKTEDAEAVAYLGKPRPSGRKKRKGSDEADVDNKSENDMLSESDGSRVKKNSAISYPSRSRKKRDSNLEDENGGVENEVMKKSNFAEKVDGSNSVSMGRKTRNSNLKDDKGGGEKEKRKEKSSSAGTGDGNSSSRGRKKRNSNVKDDNGGGKNDRKENSKAAEKVDGSNPTSRGKSNAKYDNGGYKKEEMKSSKSAEKVDGGESGDPSSRGGRKKRKSNVKDDNGVGVNEEKESKKVDGIITSSGTTKELLREESFSRERKKSKYLSPPYTYIDKGHGKKEMEAQYLKVSSAAQLGEKSTNGSPRLFKETGAVHESDASVGLYTQSQDQNFEPSLVKAPASEVLSNIRSAALNPLHLKDTNSVDLVGQFFSAFRSSSYCSETNGENSRGRKRKVEKSKPESSKKERSQTNTNNSSPDHKSQQKKIRESEETKSKDKESNVEATLFVTFGPGSSLPSENDLIKIYGKFGALNKKETEMCYASFRAKVVFLKSTEAKEAFNASQLSSPFGASNVTFRLGNISETKTRQLREITSQKPSASTMEGGKKSSESELNFMKEKLEKITSLIETSDGKISLDMKSILEGELKVLLDKVSTMISSS